MSDSCNPMEYSLPGSSVHEISQARILEWIAIPSSRGIFLTQGWNPHLLYCRWSPALQAYSNIYFGHLSETSIHSQFWGPHTSQVLFLLAPSTPYWFVGNIVVSVCYRMWDFLPADLRSSWTRFVPSGLFPGKKAPHPGSCLP